LIAGLTAAALMLAARYRMVSDRAIRREPRVA